MKTVNEVLSPEMRVPLLKDGEIARFRLINAGKGEYGRETPTTPAGHMLSGKENIYDPFSGRAGEILIQNLVSEDEFELPDGTVGTKATSEGIFFPKTGEITVTSRQNATYAFLMRSKKNLSNPFKSKQRKVRPVFFLVDDKRAILKKIADEDLYLDIRMWLKESDIKEHKSIAMNLNNSGDPSVRVANTSDPDHLLMALINVAKRAPEVVIKASGDKDTKKRVMIRDAESYDYIIWEESDRKWYFNESPMAEICGVEPGMQRHEGLHLYFSEKEGFPTYAKLGKLMKKIYKVTA